MDTTKTETWFSLDYARKHDEDCRRMGKNKMKNCLLFAFFVGQSIVLFGCGLPFLGLVVGVLASVVLAAIVIQNRYRPKKFLPFIFTEGRCTPAILSQTEPLTLWALADLSRGEAAPVYGLCRFSVQKLPGHLATVGERVPCAAVGEPSKTRPQQFLYYRLHPYCWATPSREQITMLANAIPEENWKRLEEAMAAYPDLAEGIIIELRADGTPIGRRNDRSEQLEGMSTPEMERTHQKTYPAWPPPSESDEASGAYQQFRMATLDCQVYEYFCEPDPTHFLMTFYNAPEAFGQKCQTAPYPLSSGEVPLVVCANGMLMTTKGIWYKRSFYGWHVAAIKAEHASQDKLRILLGGKFIALLDYKRQYYLEPVTDDVFYALEVKRMNDFFAALKTLDVNHPANGQGGC